MVSIEQRRGVFPGSFNPLTIAHLEVARLARRAHALDEVHLVISEVALDKPRPAGPSFADRIAILEADAARYTWLRILTTTHQLVAEIARGYDVVIMGADKWEQVNDARYYGSASARDSAVASLPRVVVAERSGMSIAGASATVLRTPDALHDVSSTRARSGERDLMAPHAQQHWSDGPADSDETSA